MRTDNSGFRAARSGVRVGFLGYTAPEPEVIGNDRLSLADNRMQQAYIRVLRAQFGDVAVLSTSEAPSNSLATRVEDGILTARIPAHRGILGPARRALAGYRYFASWARRNPDAAKVVVCYNTFTLYALVLRLLQLRFGIRTIAIAITLPYEYGPKSLSASINAWLTDWLLGRLDGVVAITEPLARRVNPHAPRLVIRGAALPEEIPSAAPPAFSKPLRLVYAGTLYDRYHLRDLVAMLDHLEMGTVELHLYGRGPLADWLQELSAGREDLHFHGTLPAAQLRAALLDADVMLVLLEPSDQLARNSFPSKLFEAMATGRPVLVSNLETLDPAMREFLEVAEDLSPAGLAAHVQRLRHLPESELVAIGEAALEYLRTESTWPVVGLKLAALIREVAGTTTEPGKP